MSKKRKNVIKNTTNNPLQSGILKFLSLSQSGVIVERLSSLNALPKRYTRYGTLLLLGPTFATHSQDWNDIYSSLDMDDRTRLYQCIVGQFSSSLSLLSDGSVTHVAINAPISSRIITTENIQHDDDNTVEMENVMRSPDGLMPLYGDFGPSKLFSSGITGDGQRIETQPGLRDFHSAYWIQTTQLQNITQVWAPRWTMFSRGNISEKARILQSGTNDSSPFPGLSEDELAQRFDQVDVLDFYVGIGYFAFCYLSRGVKRVWGWDINGWSIEGLRRGCLKNGWGVKIVRVDDDGQVEGHGGGVDDLVDSIAKADDTSDPVRLVAFLGDNRWASKVMYQLSEAFIARGVSQSLDVRHCNLGLLPSSENSWEGALKILSPDRSGWLHVHENAEVTAINEKKDKILRDIKVLAETQGKIDWSISCEHIEKVKTYAPGIMHCVFDVKLQPPN